MKKLLIIITLIFIFGIWGLIKGYKIYEKYKNYKIDIKQTEKGTIKDIELKNSKGEKINWILRAKSGKIENSKVFLNSFELTYKLKGQDIIVKANKGIIDRKSGIGMAQDNVQIILKDGTLNTSELIWDMKRNSICSRKKFVFKGKFIIWGRNFCIYPEKEFIKIRKLKRMVVK